MIQEQKERIIEAIELAVTGIIDKHGLIRGARCHGAACHAPPGGGGDQSR
jgi:hypothetical protein